VGRCGLLAPDPAENQNSNLPEHCLRLRLCTSQVGELLDRGADPTAAASDGLCPLASATMAGNVHAMRLLLAAGADPLGVPAYITSGPERAGARAVLQGRAPRWAPDRSYIADLIQAGSDSSLHTSYMSIT
jgi:ankyrin repeat protein